MEALDTERRMRKACLLHSVSSTAAPFSSISPLAIGEEGGGGSQCSGIEGSCLHLPLQPVQEMEVVVAMNAEREASEVGRAQGLIPINDNNKNAKITYTFKNPGDPIRHWRV